MKTVDQLISEWTEEEREKLKNLIEECRNREKKVLENSKKSHESLNEINKSISNFLLNLREIKEKSERIEDELLKIYLHFCTNKIASA